MICIDGTTYEGDYKDGMKDGKGKMVFEDLSIYIGDFVSNNIEG